CPISLSLRPAIFLDRDGVIIENRHNYVRSWADVEIYPQALEALANVRHSPYKIIIVTNQSAVGRGILPLGVAETINEQLVRTIERANGRVDGVFMCPHAPADNCDCRKPKPGLLLQAASAHAIDLSRSTMIGDALTDVRAGQAAGVCQSVLLLSGRGRQQALLPEASLLAPLQTYDTLRAALNDLLADDPHG
ncbi:MAG TPA: HAD family hydrolase, partial [Anaerolineae bacterium]